MGLCQTIGQLLHQTLSLLAIEGGRAGLVKDLTSKLLELGSELGLFTVSIADLLQENLILDEIFHDARALPFD